MCVPPADDVSFNGLWGSFVTDRINRRSFLKAAALAGATVGAPWFPTRAYGESQVTADEALKSLVAGNARYVAGNMNLAAYTSDRESMASG